MKTIHKMLLVSALLATPFAAAQAQNTSRAAHDAWIKAQKIDIQPTLKITETKIPADSTSSTTTNNMGNTGNSMPSMPAPNSAPSMPSQQAPSGSMPGSSSMPSDAPMGTPSAPQSSPMPYGAPQQPQ